MIDEQHKYPYLEIDPLNLRISPELVGASLEFELDDDLLQLNLPSPPDPKTLALRAEEPGPVAPGLFVNSWQHGKPIDFVVEQAKLTFLRSPEFELYKSEPQTDPHRLLRNLKEVGEEAVKLWLRVLRWKSGNGCIGRASNYDFTERKTANICVPPVKNKEGVWSSRNYGGRVNIELGLSMKLWKEVEQSLQKGEEPPLAFDLFADAVYLGSLGDYRRACLELAMAAEVYIRTYNEHKLPNSLNSYVRKEIRGFSYRKHLELFFKQLDEKGREALMGQGGIKSQLENLLEDRNTIVHHGDNARSVTIDKGVLLSFTAYRNAVKRLLEH